MVYWVGHGSTRVFRGTEVRVQTPRRKVSRPTARLQQLISHRKWSVMVLSGLTSDTARTSTTMGEVEVEVVSETCLVAHDESTPVCERCNDNMEKHEMSGVPQLWRT